MYRLGHYEIHNWVIDGGGTYRTIVDRRDPLSKNYRILILHPIIHPYPNLVRRYDWEIIFERKIFLEEYYLLGFKERRFASVNDAKLIIDNFLGKLLKLKAFL